MLLLNININIDTLRMGGTMRTLCLLNVTAGSIALLSSGYVWAQGAQGATDPTRRGWYAGGAIGSGGFKTGYEQTGNTIFSTGATRAIVSADAKETMWKAYVGYQLSNSFSIEGGYWNMGRPSYLANITAPVTTTMKRSFSTHAIGTDFVYWSPTFQSFSGFGKVGAVIGFAKATSAEPGAGLRSLPAESATTLNPLWGLGAKYDLNKNVATRLEYEEIRKMGDSGKFGTANVVMWTLGLTYKY